MVSVSAGLILIPCLWSWWTPSSHIPPYKKWVLEEDWRSIVCSVGPIRRQQCDGEPAVLCWDSEKHLNEPSLSKGSFIFSTCAIRPCPWNGPVSVEYLSFKMWCHNAPSPHTHTHIPSISLTNSFHACQIFITFLPCCSGCGCNSWLWLYKFFSSFGAWTSSSPQQERVYVFVSCRSDCTHMCVCVCVMCVCCPVCAN